MPSSIVTIFTLSRPWWLCACLTLWTLPVSAQKLKPDAQEMIFTVVERSPRFPGGSQALQRYLETYLHYPDSAAKFNVSGKVYVSFVVEPDGELTYIELLKGLGFGCDEEAIRLVKAMPRWNPGTQSGRAVRVKYNLPIMFGPK